MEPWDDLETRLRAALEAVEITDVNIYATPPATIAVPALVIRPDEPWFDQAESDPFGRRSERLAVIAVTSSADTASAYSKLRRLARLVHGIESGPFAWRSTSGIVRLESGGATYLGATIRLTYSSEG